MMSSNDWASVLFPVRKDAEPDSMDRDAGSSRLVAGFTESGGVTESCEWLRNPEDGPGLCCVLSAAVAATGSGSPADGRPRSDVKFGPLTLAGVDEREARVAALSVARGECFLAGRSLVDSEGELFMADGGTGGCATG